MSMLSMSPSTTPLAVDGANGPAVGFAAEFGNVLHAEEGALELMGNTRGYLVQDWHDPTAGYASMDLRGKTLRFTVDVSRVPCSTNAALYFVRMESGAPYCGIQTRPACADLRFCWRPARLRRASDLSVLPCAARVAAGLCSSSSSSLLLGGAAAAAASASAIF